MKRLFASIALLSLALASGLAYADNYGMAGCGLGALAFKDEPGKIQILAATVNNIISPQTSAITSGTSNCFETGNQASAIFINVNQQALRKDISKGGGESVASLSKILRCSDSELLGASLQKNYERIFPNENVSATEINESIHSAIQSDEALNQTCASVI